MANKQISQLTAKPTPVASTDQFGIDDTSSDSWKITVANLQTYFTTLYLTLSGGTMTGDVIAYNATPPTNLSYACKQYVDSVATGLNVQQSCRMASTVALTVSYNNGSSGVGATLTNAGAQAAFSLDGITAALNDRVLIKNQAAPAQNGIYTVTNLGSGATNWVLTRATDFDTAAEIIPGDFVLVLSGTANAQTQWVQTATVVTVGTDSIVWDQFGADINALILGIQNSTYVYSEDTGAADAYVATLAPAIAAYVEGNLVILDVANANTGASTINVNGLGVKNIVTEQNGALQAGDLVAGRRAWLLYDGTSYRLVNRNIEKRLQNESFNYILDTGAADAYVATLVPAITAYVAGQRLSLKIANANTGAATVNVNAVGAKDIKLEDGSALRANDLIVGMVADLRYDGTNFQLLNPAGYLTMFSAIATQSFTATGAGTYTPNAKMRYCMIEMQGAGGGSGGSTGAGGQGACSGPGGGGAYMRLWATKAQIGASAPLTVGAAGAAGASGANAGGAGGDTEITIGGGTTWEANGGGGGSGQTSSAASQDSASAGSGGGPVTGTNGTLIISQSGMTGGIGNSPAAAGTVARIPAQGGSTPFGAASGRLDGTSVGYGAGAPGKQNQSGANAAGEVGVQGIIVITEFLSP